MKKILCILSVVYVLLSGRIVSSRANGVWMPGQSPTPTTAPHHTPESATPLEIVGIFALAIGLGLAQAALVAGAIAYQFPRTLSYDPSDAWENPGYLRMLPNALAALSEHHFGSAWPRHCNPWCMNRFQRRLERILNPSLKNHAERFVRQHLSAWKWTISHRNSVTQLLRIRDREQAFRLLATAEPKERIALLAVLNTCADDELDMPNEVESQRLRRVEHLQAILCEHGYALAIEMDPLNQPSAHVLASSFRMTKAGNILD
jgi:hypothetical protein